MTALYLLIRHNCFEDVLQHIPTMASGMVVGKNYGVLVEELGRGRNIDFNVVVDTIVDMANAKAQVGCGRLTVMQVTQALRTNTVLPFIQ